MNVKPVASLTDPQIQQLHQCYQHEWWSRGRSLEDVRRLLRHSDVVVGLIDTDTTDLIAFARALTDQVFKAIIFDVIVAPGHRERGLGTILLDHLLTDPAITGVRHVELYCLPEMVPFYQRFGFVSDVGGAMLLRRMHPE